MVHTWLEANLNPTISSPYAIVANGTWAHAEHEALVALFDDEPSARAYIAASLLSPNEPARKEPGDHILRSFRRDSLLWQFNNMSHASFGSASVVRLPAHISRDLAVRLSSTPINPSPPQGAEPLTLDRYTGQYTGFTIADKL